MGLSAFLAFQSQTRRSTIPLLPPERSHICIALSAVLWAQSAAGSGVGAAAGGALDDAPTEAGGAPDWDGAPPPPTEGDATLVQPTTRTAMTARTGNRRWFLIPCSSTWPSSPRTPRATCPAALEVGLH